MEQRHLRTGEVLRRMRQIRGWSQLELANRAGLGYATIANLETKEGRDPSVTTCKKLDSAFGLLEGTFRRFVVRDRRERALMEVDIGR